MIRYLNCGTMTPHILMKFTGECAVLLVETSDGLLLVDTGIGLEDCAHPSRLMRFFGWYVGLKFNSEECAARQVERLGHTVADVHHIVMTHMHLDHAGGLPDFPAAQVHISHIEYEATRHPRGIVERAFDKKHWAHGPNWMVHDLFTASQEWFGYPAIPILPGVEPQILLIPLAGHTRGHCGVAIQTPGGWHLHCGDAISFYHRAADPYPEQHPHAVNINFLPAWFVRRVIGGQVAGLARLAGAHAEITLTSGHGELPRI